MPYLIAARAPVVWVLIFLSLFLVPQAREMFYVAVSSTPGDLRYYSPALFFAVYCTLIVLWSLRLTAERGHDGSMAAAIEIPPQAFRRPITLAMLPPLAVALELARLNAVPAFNTLDCSRLSFLISSFCAYAQAEHILTEDVAGKTVFALVLLVIPLVAIFLWYGISRNPARLRQICSGLSLAVVGFSLLLLLSSLADWSLRWDLVKFMGPLGVTLLFLSNGLVIFSHLQQRYDRGGFPWVPGLLSIFLLVSLSNCNDIYYMRRATDAGFEKHFDALPLRVECGARRYGADDLDVVAPHFDATRATASTIECPNLGADLRQAFKDWLLERDPDIQRYRAAGKKFPIYVVSGEGGGLYAAFQMAYTLAGIQDKCSTFKRHLFAISAVSGSAVGAAVFSALLTEQHSTTETATCDILGENGNFALRELAYRFLSRDFFGPLLLDGLFFDLPRSFLPLASLLGTPLQPMVQPLVRRDRATTFEDMLLRYWGELGKTSAESFFGVPIQRTWSPEKRQPALFINAAVVETGERIILSPFSWGASGIPGYIDVSPFGQLFGPDSISVATAVGLSGRFPFISPPAAVRVQDDPRRTSRSEIVHVADGGYYDNSGAITAIELVRDLDILTKEAGRESDTQIIILSFMTSRSAHFDPDAWEQSFNEIVSPVRAMFKVRALRSYQAVDAAQQDFNKARHGRCHVFLRAARKPVIPSAWYLSERAYRKAAAESGVGGRAIMNEQNNNRPAMLERTEVGDRLGTCDVLTDSGDAILRANQVVLSTLEKELR